MGIWQNSTTFCVLRLKKNLKVLLQPVTKYYIVASLLRGDFFLCHVFSIKSAQNLATAPTFMLSGFADSYVMKKEREIYRV